MKNKPVILIVDDQPQNIELLEAFLLPQGYDLICTSNGLNALGSITDNHVDLVLLDVMMPGMDGFEVTRRIRNNPKSHLLPVILVTALLDKDDRVRGIDAGCDDLISKPIDRTELLARIRSLLKVKAYNDLMINYQNDLKSEVIIKTTELRNVVDKLKVAALDTIYRLSVAAEYKDENTGTHISRIGRYCAAIARQMQIDEETVELLLYAAPMHDLGKIGIPDQILLKTSKLNALEWAIMKQHTIIGAEILKGSEAEFIIMAEEIAISHHEKWDGSGYPNQLKGNSIPISGRIVAVADVFDALTSVRPYKDAYSVEDSLAIIHKGNGSHFDPEAVKAFFAVLEEILLIKDEYEIMRPDNNLEELNKLLHQYKLEKYI